MNATCRRQVATRMRTVITLWVALRVNVGMGTVVMELLIVVVRTSFFLSIHAPNV